MNITGTKRISFSCAISLADWWCRRTEDWKAACANYEYADVNYERQQELADADFPEDI